MKNIETVILTKTLLLDAINNNTYWSVHHKIAPFAKNKAQWLLTNTRIEQNDVCAVLALNNNELIAMVNVVPDIITTPEGMLKIYWSQRWWVHPTFENSVLATYINQLSAEAVNNKILIKYIGSETIPYYKKQPYTEFSKRTRYILVYNLDAGLIISKIQPLKHLKPLLNVVSKLSYKLITHLNLLKINTNGIKWYDVSQINNKVWDFIKPLTANDLIPKTQDYINWQIDNAQYTNRGTLNHPQECLITSIGNNIHNRNICVTKDDVIIGFISVLIRANEFIIRYFLCTNKHYKYCLNVLMKAFVKSNCTFLLTENEVLGKQLNKQFLNIYCNKSPLVSLAHKDLKIDFTNKTVTEQDGHFA